MLNKLNRAGLALFVFFLTVAAVLWLTGSIHFGTVQAEAPGAAGDGHGHGDADECGSHEGEASHDAEMCAEHGVPEPECTRCDASLVEAFKAKGDWCVEHGLPESHCAACNPTRATDALEAKRCEHDVRTIDCNECRYELGVVKISPEVQQALVKTATVEEGELPARLELTGQIELDQTAVVDVLPAASGRIVTMSALLGQKVKRGDVLAVIHSSEFGEAKSAYLQSYRRYEVARSEQERQAAVSAALGRFVERLGKDGAAAAEKPVATETLGEWKSRLLGAVTGLRLARTVHEREKSLCEKNISSKAEFDQAEQELHAAEADHAALVEEAQLGLKLDQLRADNALKEAEAEVAAAEQRLHIMGLDHQAVAALHDRKDNGSFALLEVKAPRDGSVIARTASEGRFVETTESLCTIADLSNMWIWCNLYERDLALLHGQVSEGKPVKAAVRVAAFPARDFDGIVDLIDSAVDEHTRTVRVRVQVPNDDGALKPGMFATVRISIPTGERALLVPGNAVLSDEGTCFVFQHWKDDLWLRRNVTVGRRCDDHIEIVSGVPAGATVAAGGAFMLKSDVLRNKMGAGCAD